MSTKILNENSESQYREVEYRICGYHVRGRIPFRKNLNPIGRYYAGNHDENKFFKNVAAHLLDTDPRPHSVKLEGCPPMTLVSIIQTKITSLKDESRLRDHAIRYARSAERKSRAIRSKPEKSVFSLYVERPFDP